MKRLSFPGSGRSYEEDAFGNIGAALHQRIDEFSPGPGDEMIHPAEGAKASVEGFDHFSDLAVFAGDDSVLPGLHKHSGDPTAAIGQQQDILHVTQVETCCEIRHLLSGKIEEWNWLRWLFLCPFLTL